jgi:hypothetical protein
MEIQERIGCRDGNRCSDYKQVIGFSRPNVQHKQTFAARSTDYNDKYLHLLNIRSNLLTSVLKIAEGRNLGRCQVMVEFQGPPSACF